jgi:hypothetical protein
MEEDLRAGLVDLGVEGVFIGVSLGGNAKFWGEFGAGGGFGCIRGRVGLERWIGIGAEGWGGRVVERIGDVAVSGGERGSGRVVAQLTAGSGLDC